MPRKGYIAKRERTPDPVYDSTLVTKFVNSMMWDGKKSTAQGIFYGAMEQVGEKAATSRSSCSRRPWRTCKPMLEVKTRRVGGANYQVPMEVQCRTGARRWRSAGC